MSAADMKAKEFQSWSSVVTGWRKHDRRLSDAFHGVSIALLDKARVKPGQHVLGVAWIAWGRK